MGKFLRIALLFVFCMYLCSAVRAQGNATTIRGTVYDDKGLTLPGVTVTIKNSKGNGITGVDGKYSITVPATAQTLIYTFIGMQRQEVAISGRTTIDVTLKTTSTTLSDVVVVGIGYGTQRRQDINGAISSVSAAQIADIPQPSVDQMLQGKAAGITVTQNSGAPGSSTSIHIRGITSFGASEPLYVIDGVEIQGNAGTTALNSPGSSNQEVSVSPLAMLNPTDIASIDILKDASATAIYGSRGANGVIIITTKKGKAGQAHITYDGYAGWQQQGKFLDMMNLQQYANLENQLAVVYRIGPRSEFADPSILGPGTNWQKQIFSTAFMQNHNISVSGGTDKSDYYVSGGYLDQDGTILGFNFKRYSFRGVVNSQAKSWLKIGSTFGASRSDQHMSLGDNSGIIYNALLAAPDQAVYNADGSFAGPYVTPEGTREGGLNPIQQASAVSNTLTRSNITGNMYAEVKFFKDLTLRSEIDGDFNWSNAQTFNPTYSYGATGTPTQYLISNPTATLNRLIGNSTYWSWKEYFNYSHTWGRHSLSALAGREVWESQYDNVPLSGSNFIAGNNVQSIALANSVASSIPESKNSQVMESYLARVIYTFNNKYSVTANIRSDKTSNFAEGHQTGYFPGIAASWRLSDESFMSGIKDVVNNIKIRGGYGTTGNSNVPTYVYGAGLKAVPTAFGTGYIIANVANPNLKWETAIQKDLGVDFTLFNRIDGSFDYYDKTSKNFLFQKPLPYFLLGGPNEYGDNPAGIAPPYINAGEIGNKGIEITLNSRNISTKNFKWNTTLTFSHYVNKVLSLNGAPAINQSITTAYVTLPVTSTIVGAPIGEFYGYKVQGVVKTQAQLQYLATHPQNVAGFNQVVTNDPNNQQSIWLGDLQYEDTNHDGKVDASDRVPLGNPNPTFTYGFTNTFNYKDFDLSIFFYGSYGGKILNVLEYQTSGLASMYQNQLASAANYYSPTNPNSNIPAPRSGITNPNLVMSDRFLESASFLRLQNVRLGYNLPAKWATKIDVTNLKVYVSGQNLFVITKYPGLDPEVGSFNQNPTLMNLDLGRYPAPRVWTVGVNVQF
jgi:TonB-linked SusC/RagA family outer membrane protein